MKYFLLFTGALVLINQTSALAIGPLSYFTTKPQIEVSPYNNDQGDASIVLSDKRDTPHFDKDDLFFSYFIDKSVLDTIDGDDAGANTTSYVPTNTTLRTRGSGDGRDYSTLGRPGKVPLHELPHCYQRCMIDNCCNAMVGGPGDIRELTTEEFCHTKWFYVGLWIFDHLSFCLDDVCASCRPKCLEESNQWMRRVCGSHRG